MATIISTEQVIEYDFFINAKAEKIITADTENGYCWDFKKMTNKELCKRYIGYTVYFYSKKLLAQNPSNIISDEDIYFVEAQEQLFIELQEELIERNIDFKSLLEFSRLLV